MERSQNEILIGVDVGTTSTKACAHDASGRLLVTANIPTSIIRTGGAVEQDPQELLTSVTDSIAGCVAQLGNAKTAVAAVALTGQMAGLMGIDEAWTPVTSYDSWLDGRCGEQLRELTPDQVELIVKRTGCPPMVDHLPKMLWWRDRRPDVDRRIAKFVMPAVYVAGRLVGLSADEAFIDPTYLHFSGAADAQVGEWAEELIASLGLDARKLPRIVASESIVGELTPDAAERCGLRPRVPIVAGMGDTAAGVLGAGVVDVGALLDTAGTAAVLTGVVRDFRPDGERGLILMRGFPPERWLPLNYVAGAGLCLPWLATQVASTRGQATDSTVATLLAEAADTPLGAEGLHFLPHVEGRVAPPEPTRRGGWLGLGLAHTRAHLARSMLEAIAFEYAAFVRSMRRLYPDVDFSSVRAIGGGARSDLWNTIKADVLGMPVQRVELLETATRGAAMLAGAAVGLVDLHTIARDVPLGATFEPDLEHHACYAQLAAEHAALVNAQAAPPPILSTNPETSLVS